MADKRFTDSFLPSKNARNTTTTIHNVDIPNHSGTSNHLSIRKPYGEIFIYSNAVAQSVPTATYTKLTGWDGVGQCNLTENDTTNGHIDIHKDGIYIISLNASFSGTGSVLWYGGVFKNNGATKLTNLQISRKLGASGDVGAVALSGLASLNKGDTIEVWFRQDSGVNKDITIVDANLNVVHVADF